MIRSELTTGEYARLTGQAASTVRAKIARGDFPPGCITRVGTSKHCRHARFLVSRLIAAGYLPESAAVSP
ncbi:hypothetical protein [Methylibium sp.]|uniref:hypothetical protein n=1 Tax=Methylibium sp. TaxID=2067992 RepID=UPI00179A9453|nr:hypothetical protein [Methylibium sp.]MBA3588862.1 hypothetical protein [Methylibium sp.]